MKKKYFDILFSIITISVLFSIFANDVRSRFNLLSNGSEPTSYPQPYFKIIRIETPGITLGMKVKDNNKLPVGSDFVQVYISGRALDAGQSPYNPTELKYKDPFSRLPNYPPFVNWIYIPLSRIYYPDALVLQNILTTGFFFLFSVIILWREKLFSYIWKVLVIYCLLYFYTPLGYSHFEKGQFDLYVASAYLLPVTALVNSWGLGYAFAAGFFGAFKWSSVPFLGAFSAFAFLGSDSRKRWYFIVPLAVIILSVLLFGLQSLDYLPSLQYFETNFPHPQGLSFWYLMPKPLAKSFQIICLIIFSTAFIYMSRLGYRQQLFELVVGPFGLAMAAQGICFGSVSNEYRVVTMLGIIVPFVVWAEKIMISENIKKMLAASVGTFLVLVFRNFQYLPFLHLTDVHMTIIFLVFSLFWLGVGFYLMMRPQNLNND